MNYYEILEIKENASPEVIKMAYKALILKYHPDKYKGNREYAEEMTKKINEAYSILSDENKKKEYDRRINKDNHRKIEENIYDKKVNNISIDYDVSSNIKLPSIKFWLKIFLIGILLLYIITNIIPMLEEKKQEKEYEESLVDVLSAKVVDVITVCGYSYIYQLNNDKYCYTSGKYKMGETLTIVKDSNDKLMEKNERNPLCLVSLYAKTKMKNDFEGFQNYKIKVQKNSRGWFILNNNQIWGQISVFNYSNLIKSPNVSIFFIDATNYEGGFYLCIDELNMAVRVEYIGNAY